MGLALPSRWGGGFLFASAALFGVVQGLGLGLEPPGSDLLGWVDSRAGLLMALDETLVFAAVFVVPGLLGWSPQVSTARETLGLVFLGMAVPVWIFADLCLGRLVYPVYGLVPSQDVAALCLSLFYGGLHMASLLVGGALVCLSVDGARKPFGVLGLLAAAGQLGGAFPWVLGLWGTFAAQSLFVVWLAWAGLRLWFAQPKRD